ncbi:MAG: hypothetical protein HYY06_28780 [Deltaproteobacteria bacterium]|nr:hypothetical protein [Deltaproteobacteria bacterium]
MLGSCPAFPGGSSGGVWALETVDDSGAVSNSATSLALDPDGAVHIAYCNEDLRYATNGSGDWVLETADALGTTGRHASLAIDEDGAAHISYYGVTNEELRYATSASGAWAAETVADQWGSGAGTSLALDPDGAIHIAHSNKLWYATNTNEVWTEVSVHGAYSSEVSLALDAAGAAHITYRDSAWDLRYATRERLVDGIDQNCDGVDGVDDDGDGHASLTTGGDDCDDADVTAFPGAADAAGDAVDQDCDGIDG